MSKDGNHLISIVIPTLNEAENLPQLFSNIRAVLSQYRYEIIIVDGHSKDKTVSIAKKNGARVIFEEKGKGFAIRKGISNSRGDIIISMDADMSHRPEELKLLISGIDAGYDVCMGSRFLLGGGSDDMPLFRKFGNKFFIFLVNLLYGSRYTDLCYGYRSFTRDAAKKLGLKSDGFGIETEIGIKAVKKRLKVLEIPSYEKKRNAGQGKLRSFQDGWIILKTIFGNL